MNIERFGQPQEKTGIIRKDTEPDEPTLENDYLIVPRPEVKIEFSPESSIKLVQEKLESQISEEFQKLLQEVHPEDFEVFRSYITMTGLKEYTGLITALKPMLENHTGNPDATRKDRKELSRSFRVFASTFYKYLKSITPQEILGDDVDSNELARERLGAVRDVMSRKSQVGFFDVTKELVTQLEGKLV